jgi:flagellar biosynthesis protein FliQ
VTIAEYVAGFISIMLGLALADLATSLQRLLRGGAKVKWDLLTPATALLVTAFVINVWWAMFGALNAIRSLSLAALIPDIVGLLLLFCLASSVLPDEVRDDTDLSLYYSENRKRIWGLFATYTIWTTIVIGWRGLSAGLSAGTMIGSVVPNLLLASLMLLLVGTSRRWVHLLVIGLLLATTGLAWLPQELARSSHAG